MTDFRPSSPFRHLKVCATRVFFSSPATSMTNKLSTNFHRFAILCIHVYVGIHPGLRILVFDNYQTSLTTTKPGQLAQTFGCKYCKQRMPTEGIAFCGKQSHGIGNQVWFTGQEFQGVHGLRCPGLGLVAPSQKFTIDSKINQ